MTTKQFNEIFGKARKYLLQYNRNDAFRPMVEELCIFCRCLRSRDDYANEKRRLDVIIRRGFARVSEGVEYAT